MPLPPAYAAILACLLAAIRAAWRRSDTLSA